MRLLWAIGVLCGIVIAAASVVDLTSPRSDAYDWLYLTLGSVFVVWFGTGWIRAEPLFRRARKGGE
ncbi:hypothetical protein [Nonomuraea sp. NPDC001023]|uniref:hypothetical protein n=1 Tax=unclassified Nonomuraea TaxID=2593643 RepID=UPI00332CABD0